MAKKKNTFDPDALEKASREIVKKHQLRENPLPPKEAPVVPPPEKTQKKRGPKSDQKTQLCRIGISFHRRVKRAAVDKDMTIRQYLEDLIEANVPKK